MKEQSSAIFAIRGLTQLLASLGGAGNHIDIDKLYLVLMIYLLSIIMYS